jgi:hypothetical protein
MTQKNSPIFQLGVCRAIPPNRSVFAVSAFVMGWFENVEVNECKIEPIANLSYTNPNNANPTGANPEELK